MCGLVGVFGDLGISEKKIFSTMLQLDVIRGKDSTGIFSVDDKGECEVHKLAITPTDFLETSAAQRLITHADSALFGHNRAATRGKVNRSNAHPFQHGAITMMHNGTLRSVYNLDSHAKFDTDSEAIAYNLSIIEPDEAPTLIEKLNGAFALIWHDARDNSINIVRNSERPLHYMETVRGDAVYFSSELGILYASATREGFNIDDDPTRYIHEIPVGKMYKLTMDGKKVKQQKTKVDIKKKTVGVGAGATSTGTANTSTSQTNYAVSVEKLWAMTGLKANTWVECYISSWRQTSIGSARAVRGELVCNMIDDPYCTVVLYGVEKPPEGTDTIEVCLAWISANVHGNDKAKSPYAVTINGNNWRMVESVEAEEASSNVLTLPYRTKAVSECSNCGEAILEGDAYLESREVGTVCGKCYYGDSEVRDIMSLQGIDEGDMKYA